MCTCVGTLVQSLDLMAFIHYGVSSVPRRLINNLWTLRLSNKGIYRTQKRARSAATAMIPDITLAFVRCSKRSACIQH